MYSRWMNTQYYLHLLLPLQVSFLKTNRGLMFKQVVFTLKWVACLHRFLVLSGACNNIVAKIEVPNVQTSKT